jgi:hypothetical protein
MADTPRVRRERPDQDASFDDDATWQGPLPSDELATRRWMLVLGGAGLLVVAFAAFMVFNLGGDSSSPSPSQVQVGAPEATSEDAAAEESAASSTATATATANADATALAGARANITNLEKQLKEARDQAAELQRRLGANEQVMRITNERAETAEAATAAAEAALAEERSARAEIQADLDAINAELTAANADRAALTAELSAAQARADESDAVAAGLASSIESLRGCLDVHQQALYYTSLDNWGPVAAPMQSAASTCFSEMG